MEELIFHGSNKIIKQPVYGYGTRSNDFGRGFYCTRELEMAKEWACKQDTDGFANHYVLAADDLKFCDLCSDEYHILHWMAVLTRYRSYWQRQSIAEEAKRYLQDHFFVDVEAYDVIVGYRADDSYFSYAQDFVSNTISLNQLSQAMYLGKLGEQVVVKSDKAFSQIKWTGYTKADAEVYYSRKKMRDLQARKDYQEAKLKNSLVDEIYMIDIVRGRVKDDELFLR